MDKYKPSYLLKDVKQSTNDNPVIIPIEVQITADQIGFSIGEIIDLILDLEWKDFYKSTTEIIDHTVWQDVYKKRAKNVDVYLKLKIVKEKYLLIRSFKEDTGKGGKK